MTFSNSGAGSGNAGVTFRANWAVADGNFGSLLLNYNVSAPASSPMAAYSSSITAQVSNVDPANQWDSVVDGAASITIDVSGWSQESDIDLEPGGVTSGPVTMTRSSSVIFPTPSAGANVIHAIYLLSSAPVPGVGIQVGNPVTMTEFSIGVASAVSVQVIETVSATSGPVGSPVTITGSRFGASQGTSRVTFNGVDAGTALSWSDGCITVAVPSGATSGDLVVIVNGVASAAVPFTVGAPPAISNISPQSGPSGTLVTITGRNFGANQSTSTVTFGGIDAGTAASWSDTSITVYVPGGAATGNIVVNIGGAASNGMLYTVVIPPIISRISPTGGPVGSAVTITGSGSGRSRGLVP